ATPGTACVRHRGDRRPPCWYARHMRSRRNVLFSPEVQISRPKNSTREKPMLTRCSVMLVSIAAGMTMPDRLIFATAAQPSTPVNFDVPPGACDCHSHIHSDPETFHFFPRRVYIPLLTSPAEMTALANTLSIDS